MSALLVRRMIDGGYDPDDIHYAQDILDDYLAERSIRSRVAPRGEDVLAAAVEYVALRDRGLSWTQRELAERYGVSRTAIAARAKHVRTLVEEVEL